jgi:DNA-binding CsgD family transcriptional regulator
MEDIYRKNEQEANEFVSGAIRVLLIFAFIFAIFCWIGIFSIYNYMVNGFLLTSLIPLVLPTILVNLLHINGKWLKYCLILCVVLVTGVAYVIFTFQAVIIFVIPSILATFYLNKKVMLFTGVVSILNIVISHLITGFHLFEPWIEPFIGLKSILLYGALPRLLQYLCCIALLYILSIRYSKFLESFYSVIKEDHNQKIKRSEVCFDNSEFDSVTKLLTEREKDVFEFMVKGYTNTQIAKQLYLSIGTVKNYVSSIYDKIGERDRTALILKYSSYYHTYDSSHI